MTDKRFPQLTMDQLDERQRPLGEQIMKISKVGIAGPYNPMLRSPVFGQRMFDLLAYLRWNTSVPLRLNEFAILITGRLWRSQVEWYAHGPLALKAGLSPQLTLEAAILRKGGFDPIPAGASISELVYVRLRGGAEPGEARAVKFKDGGTPDQYAGHALEELTKVLAQFADPAKPYYSLLHPMWKTHYGTYDHLARVQEWSLIGGVKDGNGE